MQAPLLRGSARKEVNMAVSNRNSCTDYDFVSEFVAERLSYVQRCLNIIVATGFNILKPSGNFT
jgi:hypothetical protein